MTPLILTDAVIAPTLKLMGPKYDSPEAQTLLLAIALQESGLRHRRQVGGPARGFWQFEKGGGVRGVLEHKASSDLSNGLCQVFLVKPEFAYEALEQNDILACIFARLLLWTDPKSLPDVNDAHACWHYYLRNWRPGKPHIDVWDRNLRHARETIFNKEAPA